MNEIYECFRNRPEVPPQEPGIECQMLMTLANMALASGREEDRAYVRAGILDTLDDMHAQGMGHRDRVDAVRMVRLLESLEPAKGRQKVNA